jgi:anti-sigma factor RsiW
MTALEMEREVGGIGCGEVLRQLSDYLDGELSPEEVARVEAHLRGCDRCERFGGAFGRLMTVLRRELGPAEPLDREVAVRLRARLAAQARP